MCVRVCSVLRITAKAELAEKPILKGLVCASNQLNTG